MIQNNASESNFFDILNKWKNKERENALAQHSIQKSCVKRKFSVMNRNVLSTQNFSACSNVFVNNQIFQMKFQEIDNQCGVFNNEEKSHKRVSRLVDQIEGFCDDSSKFRKYSVLPNKIKLSEDLENKLEVICTKNAMISKYSQSTSSAFTLNEYKNGRFGIDSVYRFFDP